jgi:hypothetical protein
MKSLATPTTWPPSSAALYLFTPDVMARLIDYVREFDVEVVDDWIILDADTAVRRVRQVGHRRFRLLRTPSILTAFFPRSRHGTRGRRPAPPRR